MKAAKGPSLEGRVLLVAGATSGLGRQVAQALTAAGARVGGGGSDQGRLMALQRELDLALTLHPGDPRSAEVAVRALLDRHGRLDGLVHCPVDPEPLPAWREATARRVGGRMEQALLPAVALDQAALPLLIEQGRGFIVHVLPMGDPGAAGRAVQQATLGWSAGLAAELEAEKAPIRVEVAWIQPGPAGFDAAPDPRAVEAVMGQVRRALEERRSGSPPGRLDRLRQRLRRHL